MDHPSNKFTKENKSSDVPLSPALKYKEGEKGVLEPYCIAVKMEIKNRAPECFWPQGGKEPDTSLLEEEQLADLLQLPEGYKVKYIARERIVNGKDGILEITFYADTPLPDSLIPLLIDPQTNETAIVMEILRRKGLAIGLRPKQKLKFSFQWGPSKRWLSLRFRYPAESVVN